LVLCAVFVPCALIGGITGQFFRQFAVTIAVSTIISAINAITMTPSRAVLIFRMQHAHGGKRRPEALPWWFFAFVGGFAAYGLVVRLLAGHVGLPTAGAEEVPRWLYWTLVIAYFTPGAIVGGVIGWFIIRPVNAVLASIFRGFNAAFDGITAGYGWSV